MKESESNVAKKRELLITSTVDAANFLDEHHPGWASMVNLDTLRMDSADSCVLGQLYGDYVKGTNKLGLSVGMSSAFSAFGNNSIWKNEILRRRTPNDIYDGEALELQNKLAEVRSLKREIRAKQDRLDKLMEELVGE